MPISKDKFKNALRLFPSGVTIVTIQAGEEIHGLTVSAFASISPEPPLIVVSIDHKGTSHQLLQTEGVSFAVNILATDQAEISNHFAWNSEDRFSMGNWSQDETAAPILTDALVWMDCSIYSRHATPNHTLYVGEIHKIGGRLGDDAPLVYWNRSYRQLEDSSEEN